MTFVAPVANSYFQASVAFAFGSTQDSDPATYVWTEVSQYVRGSVTITKGKGYTPGQIIAAQPSEVSFTIENNAGWFSIDNPLSPFYPNVVIGTPVRVTLTWPGATTTYERIVAFVTGWPVTPNAGMVDVVALIQADGRLRKLSRPGKSVASPLYRAILQGSPIAYWSFEDGAGAPSAASAVAGVRPLFTGAGVVFGNQTGPAGSASLPDWSAGGSVSAKLPTGSSTTAWRVELVFQIDVGADLTGTPVLLQFTTTGAANILQLVANPGGSGGLGFIYNDGTPHGVSSSVDVADGLWHHLRFDGATPSGGHYDYLMSIDGVPHGGTGFNAGALGTFVNFIVNPGNSTAFASIGHIAFYEPWSGVGDTVAAFSAYAGELATDRVTRVCAEAGIPVVVTTGPVPAQAMGAQKIDTVGNILADCEQTDCGFLHDGGPLGKLAYVAGAARYNATTAFSLDYKRGHIGDGLAGTNSDTQLANDWKITTPAGATVDTQDAPSVAVVGEFDQQASLNTATPDQALQVGGWKSHLGGYRGLLFPATPIDLRRAPDLAQALTSLPLPARVGLPDLPAPWYPPVNLDQFAEGYTEVIDAVTWQVAFNTSPYLPYQVAVYDTARYDSATSTVHAGFNATATTFQVDTAAGNVLWSTSAAPFDINVGLEQMTVTNVTGASSPQTFTVKRSINGVVKAQTANTPVSLWTTPTYAL